MKIMRKISLLVLSVSICLVSVGQASRHGIVLDEATGQVLVGATIVSVGSGATVVSDERGKFVIEKLADTILVSAVGYIAKQFVPGTREHVVILLSPLERELDAVVVSGTMRPVKKSESPISVEVYTPQFLKKNPSPSLFESLSNVNGVRPQLNCSVCNTGDIHINGLEGPYTMVTIDGMPIVSSLASVYGLFGIPTQLIDRIEIVKGPASGLYGSEAIGGLINIITKSPEKSPLFTANFMTTSWLEHNFDAGAKLRIGKKANLLAGINYFNYQHAFDKNNDQFTDVTLQHRISIFNKLSFTRRNNRVATLAGRYFYEDRWGGDMRWSKQFRGTDSIYGESIYTNRWELIGNYQLPVNEKMFFSFSATGHHQDSYYGTLPYLAKQKIAFGQFNWDKPVGAHHNLLFGSVLRYNYYDDNSTATLDTLSGKNTPDKHAIPGMYVQDEWKVNSKHHLLLGLRYDHHPVHKSIFTPRVAWKWSLREREVIRLNAGTGFRVVSLFTEEHAALTGARAVEIKESLRPERSYNVNVNYTRHFRWGGTSINTDASIWYSHFMNQIIPDYDTDPNKIIYKNLRGFSSSTGLTLNLEVNSGNRFKSLAGVTLQDVKKVERNDHGKSIRQALMLTEKWSGTWALTYVFPAIGLTVDYTGNIYGPMRLPLLSDTDPRPGFSPVWSIQNIQFTKLLGKKVEIFGGIKNLLNWTPARHSPFLIARSNDPFDKRLDYNGDGKVDLDANGRVPVTSENPYGLTFDPAYVYAPNQGLRIFAGMRFSLKQ
ncbi:MAG: TonB-dependent receptor [Chitinophagaceae bacterium]|nr:TonB-dependent receptor [Chitinophagaceae bacterium]